MSWHKLSRPEVNARFNFICLLLTLMFYSSITGAFAENSTGSDAHNNSSRQDETNEIRDPAALSEIIQHGPEEARIEAIQAVPLLRPREEARKFFPLLKQAVSEPSPAVRAAGLRAIYRLDVDKKELQSIEEAGLQDSHDDVRRVSAMALGNLLRDTKSKNAALERALTDSSPQVRFRAAEGLERIGSDAGIERALCTYAALLSLRVKLEPFEKTIHEYEDRAASYFDNRGNADEAGIRRSLPKCANLQEIKREFEVNLTGGNQTLRAISLKGIRWLGEHGGQFAPMLIKRLAAEPHPILRVLLLQTLGEPAFFSKESQNAVSPFTRSSFPEERQAAYQALSGAKPEEALATIMQGLNDKNEKVRISAMRTLALFGKDSEKAITPLRKILYDNSRRIEERGQAAQTLKLMKLKEADGIVDEFMQNLPPEER